jgi:hypothetical protein
VQLLNVPQQGSATLHALAACSSCTRLAGYFFYELPVGCLAGPAQLSRLTSLRLTGGRAGIRKQLQQLLALPLPLQQLEAYVLDIRDVTSTVVTRLPSLAHLTQVTELILTQDLSKTAALPPQLQALHLSECRHLAPVLELQQLQRLTLCPEYTTAEQQRQVLQLAKLPSLQELQLSYRFFWAAAAAAPTWALLPQLRGLIVERFMTTVYRMDAPEQQHIAAALAGAAAATQLTSLQLGSRCLDLPLLQQQPQLAMPVCGSLTGLSGLRYSKLQAMKLVHGDALALTALTGLTRLDLCNFQDGFGVGAANELVRKLKHLAHLELRCGGIDLGSNAFLAAVGQLKQLKYLCLEGIDGLTEQGLMQLTGLQHLQQLHVDRNEEVVKVTAELLSRLWAAVRQQQ